MGIALVTGASAGLGTELARLFAADHHDVILVARRKDRLETLGAELSAKYSVKTYAIAGDLMDPAAPAAILAAVEKLGLAVDYLVNNAGFGSSGPFYLADPAREVGQVACNVTALVALTRGLLPGMIARKRGHVLNISSTAGFQPGPYMATYFATKAFVTSFTRALAFELKGTGVSATVSCPGATATEFFGVAAMESTRLASGSLMTAPEVAASAYRAMMAGRPVVIPGLKNRVLAWASTHMPSPVVLAIAASLNRPPA